MNADTFLFMVLLHAAHDWVSLAELRGIYCEEVAPIEPSDPRFLAAVEELLSKEMLKVGDISSGDFVAWLEPDALANFVRQSTLDRHQDSCWFDITPHGLAIFTELNRDC